MINMYFYNCTANSKPQFVNLVQPSVSETYLLQNCRSRTLIEDVLS